FLHLCVPSASTQTEGHVNGASGLNVVILQPPARLELFSVVDQPLLVHWRSLFLEDLRLQLIDGLFVSDVVSF
ncbi:hypothetical protein C0J45_4417, partial [Silurus meridionalis]